MERMMVAFGEVVSVLHVQGKILEVALDGDSESFNEEVSGWGVSAKGEDASPDSGIWVWEGEPKEVYNKDEAGLPEYDYTDFSQGNWREPTALEMALAVKGYNPWSKQVEGLELKDLSDEAR